MYKRLTFYACIIYKIVVILYNLKTFRICFSYSFSNVIIMYNFKNETFYKTKLLYIPIPI